MKNIIDSIKSDLKKEPKRNWFIIAFIWLIIILSLTEPSWAKESELTFGSILEASQNEMDELYSLQKAISTCEGYYKEGSIAKRLNNPGNLKAGGTTDWQRHTIYPSPTAGYLAHLELLSGRYKGMTPYQMNLAGYAVDKNWYYCVNYFL